MKSLVLSYLLVAGLSVQAMDDSAKKSKQKTGKTLTTEDIGILAAIGFPVSYLVGQSICRSCVMALDPSGSWAGMSALSALGVLYYLSKKYPENRITWSVKELVAKAKAQLIGAPEDKPVGTEPAQAAVDVKPKKKQKRKKLKLDVHQEEPILDIQLDPQDDLSETFDGLLDKISPEQQALLSPEAKDRFIENPASIFDQVEFIKSLDPEKDADAVGLISFMCSEYGIAPMKAYKKFKKILDEKNLASEYPALMLFAQFKPELLQNDANLIEIMSGDEQLGEMYAKLLSEKS